MLCGIFRSFPQPCALDVHPDIVAGRIPQGKVNGVLPLSAAEFHDNRPVIFEEGVPPMPFQRVVGPEHFLRAGLHEAADGFVFPEFPEFVLSHKLPFLFPIRNGADYFFLRLLFFLLLRRFLRSSSKRVMLSSPTAETKSGADASGSLLRESGLTPLRFILMMKDINT